MPGDGGGGGGGQAGDTDGAADCACCSGHGGPPETYTPGTATSVAYADPDGPKATDADSGAEGRTSDDGAGCSFIEAAPSPADVSGRGGQLGGADCCGHAGGAGWPNAGSVEYPPATGGGVHTPDGDSCGGSVGGQTGGGIGSPIAPGHGGPGASAASGNAARLVTNGHGAVGCSDVDVSGGTASIGNAASGMVERDIGAAHGSPVGRSRAWSVCQADWYPSPSVPDMRPPPRRLASVAESGGGARGARERGGDATGWTDAPKTPNSGHCG
jgi:hypothetical protein